MATIQELAAQLANAFETVTRADGTELVKLTEGSPEWMSDACMDAHNQMFPDDWRYEAICQIAQEISECDDVEDERGERVDSCVSVYTSELTSWLNSRADRHCYCDDAAEEFGVEGGGGIIKLMQLGQYAEFDEIWGSLVGALENVADEPEDDADPDVESLARHIADEIASDE